MKNASGLGLTFLLVFAFLGASAPRILPLTILLAITSLLLVFCWMTSNVSVRPPVTLFALIGLSWLSLLWTADAELTVKAALATTVVGLAGVMVGANLDFSSILRVLDRSGRVIAALSLGLAWLDPLSAFETRSAAAGSLIGIYVHKNLLASVLCVGVISMLFRERSSLSLVLGGSVYGLSLYLSLSSAAWVLAGLAVVLTLLRPFVAGLHAATRRAIFAVTGPVALGAGLVVTRAYSDLVGLLGRDATLSGRTDIWQASLRAVHQEPILGYGWGIAYEPDSIPAQIIRSQTGYYVAHAHNAALHIALHLGLLGVVVMSLAFIRIAWLALRDGAEAPTREAVATLMFATYVWLYAVIEPVFQGVGWFILAMTLTYLNNRKGVTAKSRLREHEMLRAGHTEKALSKNHSRSYGYS
jgi:exopolysaccharide production protein ExoQ